jgi:hypothetical protein
LSRRPNGKIEIHASGNNSVVECDLAKVEVAGSNPVSRSNLRSRFRRRLPAVALGEGGLSLGTRELPVGKPREFLQGFRSPLRALFLPALDSTAVL